MDGMVPAEGLLRHLLHPIPSRSRLLALTEWHPYQAGRRLPVPERRFGDYTELFRSVCRQHLRLGIAEPTGMRNGSGQWPRREPRRAVRPQAGRTAKRDQRPGRT